MAFFPLIVIGYCLLIVGGRRLFGTRRHAGAQTTRRRQALRWLYGLTTAPVCLAVLAYGAPRVSLTNDLLPTFAWLAVGSGVVAGTYVPEGRGRWLLRAHAVVGGLLAPVVAYGFWVAGGLGKPLYQQYPFTVQVRSEEFEASNWTWKGYAEPKSYYTNGLYKAYWGFDYYVGDIRLEYPLQAVGVGPFSPTAVALDKAFWNNVRSLTLSPADDQGQLRVLLPSPMGDYVTGEVSPVVEQTLPFGVTRSPAQPPQP